MKESYVEVMKAMKASEFEMMYMFSVSFSKQISIIIRRRVDIQVNRIVSEQVIDQISNPIQESIISSLKRMKYETVGR
jgi:predicted transcriptional regulator